MLLLHESLVTGLALVKPCLVWVRFCLLFSTNQHPSFGGIPLDVVLKTLHVPEIGPAGGAHCCLLDSLLVLFAIVGGVFLI